jgi:tRNA-splicing ligase RtcB
VIETQGMHLIDGIPVWGEVDENTLTQIKQCALAPDIAHVALMADNHLGYAVPIGGVVAYHNSISPSGVGYDIGCGNKAVRTDMEGAEARKHIRGIMDDIQSKISFGVGRHNAERVDHDLFDDPGWSEIKHLNLRDKAAAQLGTVGSGNHYVDIFTDEEDLVWVGVHFGSRGLGHDIAQWALKAGGAVDTMMAAPLVVHESEALFDGYLAGMLLAGRYAYAGRDWVANKVVTDILQAKVTEEVHNHHNFAWREIHQGEWLWVVRKGATPAYPGQRGFIGATMGDYAVIVEGADPSHREPLGMEVATAYTEQRESLFSTVHGAGRAMSRTAAAGRRKRGRYGKADGKLISEGRIATEFGIKDSWALTDWLREHRGVELRGAGLDEAPQAYKNLTDVLQQHQRTINVLHSLKPIGVVMAGADVRDPYKD